MKKQQKKKKRVQQRCTVAVFFVFTTAQKSRFFSPSFQLPSTLSINRSFHFSSLLPLNGATLSPNSIGKDILPNNLGLCKFHLSFHCLLSAQINITATTLNVTGLVFKA